MALSITVTDVAVNGNKRRAYGTLAFDNSYPANGEAYTARQFGLSVLESLELPSTHMGLAFEVDYANKKIKTYVPGVQVGAAGSVTLDDFPLAGVGASAISVSLTNSGGSATHRLGVQKEVEDTEDLSTITGVPWVAHGV